MKRKAPSPKKPRYPKGQFFAEAEYANSIVREAFGDQEGCIAALRRSLQIKPDYPPSLLSLGSVEYQLGNAEAGRRLFQAILTLPADTKDLCEIIDEAGTFLIHSEAYADGLSLYRGAVARFPEVAALQQGLGCCAGHEGAYEEALAASEEALRLDSDNQKYVNDLGWTLLLAGRLEEARRTLERAVAMDPSDELARENLRICLEQSSPSRKRARSPRAAKPPI